MSDLQLYELEDISWDELCPSDDHIVPHPSSGRSAEPVSQNDSRKKPRHEAIGLTSKTGDQSASKYANQQKEQIHSLLSNRSPIMLEKDSWSDAPAGAFPSTREKASADEASSLPSEITRTSNQCFEKNNIDSIDSEFSPNNGTLGDKNVAVGGNSYSYPLDPISQGDDGLSFFDSNREDKDSNDLLYYNWPEIENFEDVDRMFRSCDSTFGFGPGNEDDLGWFSSSDVVEGSGEGLTSGFKFPCPPSSALGSTSASHETSRPNETNISTNNSGTENQSLGYNGSSWSSDKNASLSRSNLSFMNESNNSECKLAPEKKAELHGGGVQVELGSSNQPRTSTNVVNSIHKKHSKHQNRSEGKRKGMYIEARDTFNYSDNLPEERKHHTGVARTQVNFRSADFPQQKQAHGPDFGYLGSSLSYMHSDYSLSDQSTLHPTLQIIKSENNGPVSLSPKDSYASNHVQSMESSPDPSFQVGAVARNEKEAEKLFHHSGVKVENYSDLEGISTGIPAELGSPVMQECCSISSGLNEISEEAASFHQLQRVMEQLDIRTKLCIRDSLYRLARSAEQRHRHANINNGSGDGGTSGPLISEETNKCTGYMDIETDTNPIDRSIAHLLFHRPSDSSVTPARDSSTPKPPSMIQGSLSNVPVMGESLISHGEIAPQTDREVADHSQ